MKKFIIEDSFWSLFPDAKIGIVICNGIDNSIKDKEQFAEMISAGETEALKYLSLTATMRTTSEINEAYCLTNCRSYPISNTRRIRRGDCRFGSGTLRLLIILHQLICRLLPIKLVP